MPSIASATRSPRPKLAKLSPPRLRWIGPRQRLFRQFDEAARSALVWLSGPPGAGKTSVIASWLDARGRSEVWYQCDVVDVDVASAFHYLALAAEEQAPGSTLPRLTPEYAGNLEVFARKFFRQFFAALRDDSVVVFDNFQEAATSLESLLALAIEEVPEGITLMVASRTAPGVALARAFAHHQAVHIDAESLVLDEQEAKSLSVMHSDVPDAQVRAAHAASQGWAAGFMLILERSSQPASQRSAHPADAQQALFDYIASLLFREVQESGRQALALTALLPRFTLSEARVLSPETDPAPLIEHLYGRCLFIGKRESDEAIYEFHALLREFLLAQLRRLLTPAELSDARTRAAAVLHAGGDHEGALALYREARNLTGVERVLISVADAWLGQGRHRLVAETIASLPEDPLTKRPALLRLYAVALLPTDQPKSRALAILAYESCRTTEQFEDKVLSAVAVIDTFLGNFSDYSGARIWAQRLADALYAEGSPPLPAQVRAEALSAFLASAALADTDHDALEEAASEVCAFVRDARQTEAARTIAGIRLLTYCAAVRSFRHVEEVRECLLDLVERPSVSPFRKGWCWIRYAQSACMYRSHRDALDYLERAAAVAREHRLSTLLSLALVWQISMISFDGKRAAVQQLRDEMARCADPRRPFEAGNLAIAELYVSQSSELSGGSSLEHIRRALETADGLNALWIRLSYRSIVLLAMALHAPADDLQRIITETRAIASGTRYWRYGADAEMIWLYRRLTGPDADAAVEDLRKVLPRLVDCYPYVVGPWAARVYGTVLTRAIDEGVVPGWAAQLMRVHGLSGNSQGSATSGPAVRIRVLGDLQLTVGDECRTMAVRRSQKVGELLALLVAFGPSPLARIKIADMLWPDAEGDRAHRALKVTIHRLRRLLGHDAAVVVEGGRVGLERTLVWADAWALEEACDHDASALANSHSGSESPFRGIVGVLYRGDLLQDVEFSWAEEPRRRLRRRMEQFERGRS